MNGMSLSSHHVRLEAVVNAEESLLESQTECDGQLPFHYIIRVLMCAFWWVAAMRESIRKLTDAGVA